MTNGFSCALLAPRPQAEWFQDWVEDAKQAADIGKLLPLSDAQSDGSPKALDEVDELRVMDAILMFVTQDSLGWARRWVAKMKEGQVPLLAITKGIRADSIQNLLRLGANDFLSSNCKPEELKLRLWQLRNVHGSRGQAKPAGAASDVHPALGRIIGTSRVFRQQVERVPLVAHSDVSVLILGETGTGKELFAQATHYLSQRAETPWVAVNCGALPADLIESELFGHTRGAYTSAHQSQAGLVAEAEGGTLFLDEVDSLPLAAQAKLLRFLQEKEYRPVGSSRAVRANVRIVAASNSELGALSEQGRFRKDLYYRLNVLTLKLPALRERLEDMLPLAEHFIARFSREFQRPFSGLSHAALERIVAYHWPGNVRELEHSIERAVLLCSNGKIEPHDLDLPSENMLVKEAEPFKDAKARAVEQFERQYIERMLFLNEGNISRAADAAAKNRRAFWELMRKHRIGANRYRSGMSL